MPVEVDSVTAALVEVAAVLAVASAEEVVLAAASAAVALAVAVPAEAGSALESLNPLTENQWLKRLGQS